MENGSAKKRDMLDASKAINSRANPFWPLILLGTLLISSIWTTLEGIRRAFMWIFKTKKSVKGKVVVVTGAGRGLGRGMCLKLSDLGAHIACLDVHEKNNEETVRLIKQKGGIAQAFSCNIAKSSQVEQVKNQIIASMGPVDIVINNAALLMAMPQKEMEYDDIRAMYEVNLMGPAFVTKAFLGDMLKRNSGHIVAISSVAAWSSVPYLNLYCSTKSGLSRYFESMRIELNDMKNNEIKVSIVHPYFINTSADYTSWFQCYIPVLEENYVVNKIIDAILYEKESVAVPDPLKVIQISDALTPSFQYNILMNFFRDLIKIPSKAGREVLPYASIVSDLAKTANQPVPAK